MTPQDAVASLDRSLAKNGQTCILRRKSGAPGSQTNVDVTLKAFVRTPTAEDLAAGYKVADLKVILSFTEILAAGWPGNLPAGALHPEIPRGGSGGDQILILGTPRGIEAVNPIQMNDVLVRCELRAVG